MSDFAVGARTVLNVGIFHTPNIGIRIRIVGRLIGNAQPRRQMRGCERGGADVIGVKNQLAVNVKVAKQRLHVAAAKIGLQAVGDFNGRLIIGGDAVGRLAVEQAHPAFTRGHLLCPLPVLVQRASIGCDAG